MQMMIAKHLTILVLASMILFSASVPVYATHIKKTEPTADEKRLFEKIFARLESHADLMPVQVDDVRKSLSEQVKIFFSCRPFKDRAVESVTVNVRTQFASFDSGLAEKHKTGVLSGMYVWDCKAINDRYTLTIECVNIVMLNPDFLIKEETETDERKIVAIAENEMVLYHELLHGELMIDAMKDSNDNTGWRKNACSLFANNNRELDYAPSDGEHKIISGLELDYLARVVKQQDGVLIIKTIDRRNVGKSDFTQVIATFDELGTLAKSGFFVFARAVNMESVNILVSTSEETIAISGSLQDANNDGIVRVFVLPKVISSNVTSNVKLHLDVDDTLKSRGSEFTFTATVQNLQSSDIGGTIRLGIDGKIVASQNVDVPANKEKDVRFVWKSDDLAKSKYVATIDGFNTASNKVNVFTFDKLESRTVNSNGIVTEQVIVDPDTRERISVAKPSRISAMIIVNDDDTEVLLIAPDGTSVIGNDALINEVGSRVHLVTVNDQTLAVKYTELNERLRFLAVKTTLRDVPLPSGEWSIKAVNPDGSDADTRIKYYVNYVGST